MDIAIVIRKKFVYDEKIQDTLGCFMQQDYLQRTLVPLWIHNYSEELELKTQASLAAQGYIYMARLWIGRSTEIHLYTTRYQKEETDGAQEKIRATSYSKTLSE